MPKQNTLAKESLFEKMPFYFLLAAVFLVPLAFVPGTANVLDFPKQIILFGLSFLALFFWAISSLREGKVVLAPPALSIPLLSLVLISGISTLSSVSPYESFWGWALSKSGSFLSIFGLAVFSFLATVFFHDKKKVNLVLTVFFASLFLVGLYCLLQILGIFVFSFSVSKINSFNPIGTINGVALLFSLVLPLVFANFFSSKNLYWRIFLGLFFLVSLALMLLINFWVSWICLMIGFVLILVSAILKGKTSSIMEMVAPSLIVALALFALITKASFFNLNLPSEVSPSVKASYTIALEGIKGANPPFSWFFGAGPSSFNLNYFRYRPLEVNQTVFWSTRFFSGASEILTKFLEIGPLGLLSFLSIIVFSFLKGIKGIISKTKDEKEWLFLRGLIVSLVGFTLSFILYPAGFGFLFCFWVIVSLIFSTVDLKKVNLQKEDKKAPWLSFVSVAILICLMVSGIVLSLLIPRKYLAEVNYYRGVDLASANDFEGAIQKVQKAVQLTSSRDSAFLQDLSQLYLLEMNQEKQEKGSALFAEENRTLLSSLLEGAVSSAKAGTETSPKSGQAWQNLGLVYDRLKDYATTSSDYDAMEEGSLTAYEKAGELESSNPAIFTEMGRIYMERADFYEEDSQKSAEMLASAKKSIEKALQLKNDYSSAQFQMAMVDVREGRTDNATSRLEWLFTRSPSDASLAFQLGILYQADGRIEDAKAMMEKAVSLDPNFSNARYILGFIYEKEGSVENALYQFEKVLELNPGNADLEKIISNLKEGKSALEGITAEE